MVAPSVLPPGVIITLDEASRDLKVELDGTTKAKTLSDTNEKYELTLKVKGINTGQDDPMEFDDFLVSVNFVECPE